nr:uncharacterized protein LOC117217594 [Megalopta genalis]
MTRPSDTIEGILFPLSFLHERNHPQTPAMSRPPLRRSQNLSQVEPSDAVCRRIPGERTQGGTEADLVERRDRPRPVSLRVPPRSGSRVVRQRQLTEVKLTTQDKNADRKENSTTSNRYHRRTPQRERKKEFLCSIVDLIQLELPSDLSPVPSFLYLSSSYPPTHDAPYVSPSLAHLILIDIRSYAPKNDFSSSSSSRSSIRIDHGTIFVQLAISHEPARRSHPARGRSFLFLFSSDRSRQRIVSLPFIHENRCSRTRRPPEHRNIYPGHFRNGITQHPPANPPMSSCHVDYIALPNDPSRNPRHTYIIIRSWFPVRPPPSATTHWTSPKKITVTTHAH